MQVRDLGTQASEADTDGVKLDLLDFRLSIGSGLVKKIITSEDTQCSL